MMNRILINRIIISVSILFFSVSSFSQGLVENELITNQTLISKSNKLKPRLRAVLSDTLSLGVKGILDDFSYEGPYPDTTIWIDNKVFINRDFPKAPITLGVATFDGLDFNGYPYDFLAASGSSAIADYLTSKPVNLNYPSSDSIYFSFYYQPQGLGNAPESVDSLVVQFKNAGGWRNVWAKKGSTLAVSDSSWKLVMIPITDTAYLKSDFQFRFMNRATISGNTDHWSIDYVYLNRIRSKNDTTFEDVSFVFNTPPLISTYSAMPWKQYGTTDMKVNYNTTIRNNHTAIKNGNFAYKIYDESGVQVNTTYSGGSTNLDPFAVVGYINYSPFTNPPLNYTIPVPVAATRYTIESIVNSTPDNERGNDTIRYVQDLTNYFAYDDGTAENSFGMSTLSAKLAEKFTLKVADSLQYIDIYFNPFVTNTSIYTFNLQVWSDAGGVPGIAVYTGATAENPAYGGVTHNQFMRYKLDAPLYLSPGIFYVGFTQNTNQFLNVGVDKNTNTQNMIYYNISGSWNTSPFNGSLMLHPVFGSISEFAGVDDISQKKNIPFTVYPNPANNELFIKADDNFKNERIEFSIMDVFGKAVTKRMIYSDFIDISGLNAGVYFVSLNSGKTHTIVKFIKLN